MYINNTKFKPKRFSSGEMKLLYEDFKYLEKDNEINIIYNNEESIFELFLISNFLKSMNKKINLFLSYLPYQRMDKTNDFELKTIQYVANIFNILQFDKLYIGEPHCNTKLFNNSFKIPYVELILNELNKTPSFIDSTLVFTDKGALKRYGHLNQNSIYFEKKRDKNSGLIIEHKLVGKIRHKNLLFIDDIISTGDTIISCINLLPDDVTIDIVCGHFEKNAYNNRLFDINKIHKIYSTNSLIKTGTDKLILFPCEELIKNFKDNNYEINK